MIVTIMTRMACMIVTIMSRMLLVIMTGMTRMALVVMVGMPVRRRGQMGRCNCGCGGYQQPRHEQSQNNLMHHAREPHHLEIVERPTQIRVNKPARGFIWATENSAIKQPLRRNPGTAKLVE